MLVRDAECCSLLTAAIWSRLGKSDAGTACMGVDGSIWDDGSFATRLDCDVCDVNEEKDASEAVASLRGDRLTGGGDLCTTMVDDVVGHDRIRPS